MEKALALENTSFDMADYTAEEVGRQPIYCPICGKPRKWHRGVICGKEIVVNVLCKCETELERKRAEDDKHRQETQRINAAFGTPFYGEALENASFENYEQLAGTKTAYKAMRDFAKEFETARPRLGICLFGRPGNGKSHLSAALGHEVEKLDYSVVYQYVPDLISRILASYDAGNGERESSLLRAMQMCDLLILDDAGAEKGTEWTKSKLAQIIEGRSRNGRPIVITANLENMAKLEDYIGFRAYDRVVGMCMPVENKGESYRRRMAIQRLRAANG